MTIPTIILGGPGCGKTTRLLDIMEQEIEEGTPSHRIGVVTFTRAGAAEARDRAAERFGLDPETDLPHVRTIHSLCYHALEATAESMMGPRDWESLEGLAGTRLTSEVEEDDETDMDRAGRVALELIGLAETKRIGLREVYERSDRPDLPTWNEVQYLDDKYSEYKADTAKFDFSDLLRVYVEDGKPVDVDVAIIDEAQDLSPAQWSVVERAFSGANRMFIAGDDDQSIYEGWAGADVDHFLALEGEVEVLPTSYRLPEQIYLYSQRIVERIRDRRPKTFGHRARVGKVEAVIEPKYIDLRDGEWLLLARHRYLLWRWEQVAADQGIPYKLFKRPVIDPGEARAVRLWEELRGGLRTHVSAPEARDLCKAMGERRPALRETEQYTLRDLHLTDGGGRGWFTMLRGISERKRNLYAAVLDRHGTLDVEPRVTISTIHQVKGAEAEKVAVLSDISPRADQHFARDPDAEHRVFYVAVTRAREELYLVAPQGDTAYPVF